MDPGCYAHRILLCVTGLSPQIITETLYRWRAQDDGVLSRRIFPRLI